MRIKPNILYVDDESNNLTGFKATFRRDYRVYTAESGKEALEILNDRDFQVIISDQRMPGMTGVDFFESIKESHPEPVRMLLTGYSDIESVIKAINEGNVYRYITKPWEEQDLKMTIDNAVEYYNAKNELRERNIELEKAYNELEKFIYSASHNMRAPLASVLGIVQLAKMENDNPAIDDYLQKIESSVDKLDVFIQNTIAYYRSENLEVKSEAIDFKTLFEEALQSVEYYEEAQSIEIKMDIKQNNTYLGDIARTRLLINNLISNAIRFQKPGSSNKLIEIKADVNEDEAIISVCDNGIGIAPENQEKIFDMFYSTVPDNTGSGIGLYIVKETLKKLQGTIEVDSSKGEYSKFKMTIPSQK